MAQRLILANNPQPVPARYGLLSAASVIDEANPHGYAGVEFDIDPCGPATSYITSCPPPEDPKEITQGVGTRGADPFTVIAGFNCAPVGFTDADMERIARAALTNGEGRAVEATFWTGEGDAPGSAAAGVVRPHLAEDTASTDGRVEFPEAEILNGGLAMPLREALAALERELGLCYPGRGTLHMTRDTASLLGDRLYPEGGNLVTRLGTLVAAGAGYPGTSPAGGAPASGDTWIYATGAVVVRRGPVELLGNLGQSLDRGNNTVVRILERTYVVTWDCCLLAVRATLEAS